MLVTKQLGLVDYLAAWRAMRDFSAQRRPGTPDEIWLLQHPPVYTLGLSCKLKDYNAMQGIPLVASDRGGKITYHGPGQIVAYVLLDLKRRGWGVRALVAALEEAVIGLLEEYGIPGERRISGPGVYVEGKKVASLGLRVRQGMSYHGLSMNVDMNLEPFRWIHPCGDPELDVTQLVDLGVRVGIDTVSAGLLTRLTRSLGYTKREYGEIRG